MSEPLQEDGTHALAQRRIATLTFATYLIVVAVVVPVLYYSGYDLALLLAMLVGLLAWLVGLVPVRTRRMSGIVLVLLMVFVHLPMSDTPVPSGLLVVIAVVLTAGLWYPPASAVCALSLVLVFFLAFLGLPAMPKARDSAFRVQCSSNMKQIVLALHNYHDVSQCFPPAFVRDENGKPKHSWRVLILPFLGEQALYADYDFDEPWDSPNNRTLLTRRPSAFRCAAAWQAMPTAAYTDYFAVVGPSTAWPGPVGRKLSELADPNTTTILLVEAAGQNVLWTQPRDLTLEEAMQLVESSEPSHAGDTRHIAMVEDAGLVLTPEGKPSRHDGVYRVSTHLRRDLWASLLTINDGAQPSEQDLLQDIPVPPRFELRPCVLWGVWTAVMLLPLPWLWLNRRPTRRRSAVPGRLS